MRTLAAYLFAVLVFAAPAEANQRTGYLIKGCTHYQLVGSKVVQVCDPRKPGNPLFWDTVVSGGGGEPGTTQ